MVFIGLLGTKAADHETTLLLQHRPPSRKLPYLVIFPVHGNVNTRDFVNRSAEIRASVGKWNMVDCQHFRVRSPMPNFISEDQIEQAILQRLQFVHGYDVENFHTDDREDL